MNPSKRASGNNATTIRSEEQERSNNNTFLARNNNSGQEPELGSGERNQIVSRRPAASLIRNSIVSIAPSLETLTVSEEVNRRQADSIIPPFSVHPLIQANNPREDRRRNRGRSSTVQQQRFITNSNTDQIIRVEENRTTTISRTSTFIVTARQVLIMDSGNYQNHHFGQGQPNRAPAPNNSGYGLPGGHPLGISIMQNNAINHNFYFTSPGNYNVNYRAASAGLVGYGGQESMGFQAPRQPFQGGPPSQELGSPVHDNHMANMQTASQTGQASRQAHPSANAFPYRSPRNANNDGGNVGFGLNRGTAHRSTMRSAYVNASQGHEGVHPSGYDTVDRYAPNARAGYHSNFWNNPSARRQYRDNREAHYSSSPLSLSQRSLDSFDDDLDEGQENFGGISQLYSKTGGNSSHFRRF